ncbi:hypothetical protein XBI1_2850003 [Xenorhabdus bovienii str. Intermedium]|uniref:Uncharacterized protein n=1 Tax=Xenorhabdus bovienii str. Intermedium TaxID=1379677 RepID=A0A077QLC8_XENBV|nr:hypothetical protein XBI1_2850003 [Xenorhabdus bovienii str. Intermedium]
MLKRKYPLGITLKVVNHYLSSDDSMKEAAHFLEGIGWKIKDII